MPQARTDQMSGTEITFCGLSINEADWIIELKKKKKPARNKTLKIKNLMKYAGDIWMLFLRRTSVIFHKPLCHFVPQVLMNFSMFSVSLGRKVKTTQHRTKTATTFSFRCVSPSCLSHVLTLLPAHCRGLYIYFAPFYLYCDATDLCPSTFCNCLH